MPKATNQDDRTLGAEVTLTHDQYDVLARFVPRRHRSVRLRARGAAYVEAELLDREGNVTKARLLFPRTPKQVSQEVRRRWLWRQQPQA
jgi:hypothetical protein